MSDALRVLPRFSLAALALAAAGLFWAEPARADHDDEIFCEVHHRRFAPHHFRSHAAGYVVLRTGGYRFYPQPAYDVLVDDFYGRPAVFVSSGYFYPLWVGYGPVYEPAGYFELHGGRIGRTHLGLSIGFNALPSLGFGFLSRPGRVVHYVPYPRWHSSGRHIGAPHLRHHVRPFHHGRGHAPKRHFRHD